MNTLNAITEPKINGIARNIKIVAEYIGCLTTLYKPLSITVCPSTTLIVRDK